MSITAILLACMHVEVEMRERKLANRQSQTERAHHAKRSINLLKRHKENILYLVPLYEVLIKLGSADICPHMGVYQSVCYSIL